ncbi:hypothetical protein CXG81DRAFT_14103 [Caulochytrium protostelioides]|uniref:Flap endonuclease 1 n=1 Tax=Caulochytrium protostelioides TaxID=1555241 RepID=A0A4V1IU92_9FUNG|nr:hypothetical protein CXG81DRAFT_14103 [Caulochytrium protostelioides]|eukprot:RKO99748.1 hypothetical protein CXG81DRAFT_14103 [Caulochytrium protostelioides]
MGVQGLTKLIGDHAPGAIREHEMKDYFGRKVAVDASMCLYQFLIAVRSEGQNLTNEDGETTSHLMGFFYRTLRMMDNGIKPIYVFDGKPPQMKSGELAKRGARRAAAEVSLKEAQEAGEQENIDKYTRRLVRVTKEHNTEVQQLLTLMGIPFVVAPAEAEAQCAALAAAGKVYGAASEDMDTLTFGTPTLLRHMTYSENRKKPINEVSYEQVLEGLEMTKETFVDLCILLGCDYCESIRGIGPHRALALLREHQSIENILASLDPDKFTVPEDWPYAEARRLFLHPDVADPATFDFEWKKPDEEGLVQFMVNEKGFSEKRIRDGIAKLNKISTTATQGRLDGFFTAAKRPAAAAGANAKKRAAPASGAKSAPATKKRAGGSGGRPRR